MLEGIKRVGMGLATAALAFGVAANAMADSHYTEPASNIPYANSLALKMKEKGFFPFVLIGGDEKLQQTAQAVVDKVATQIPISIVKVPDLDGDTRHMVVKTVGNDNVLCVTDGYNGELDSFQQKLQEAVQTAYTGNCGQYLAR